MIQFRRLTILIFGGLIETLRHDFDDHFLLLPTHERDYRDLLVYKLRKWNIQTEMVDMLEVNSKR